MKNILICGDSFAADWSVKYRDYPGWPVLLKQKYNVTNTAQAGCSEYKILKQLQSQDLSRYQCIIVVHTSPYRIPVETHPLHHSDVLHKDSDFIYLDIKNSSDQSVECVTEYYEKYFWCEHAMFVHKCTLAEELNLLGSQMCLHLAMNSWDNLVEVDKLVDFSYVFENYSGTINHLSETGNNIVFQKLLELIQ